MITHLSSNPSVILQRGDISLQVTRFEDPCCRSFGPISYRFEDYIRENNNWHIFYMRSDMGSIHRFHKFWMIHGSRLGGVEMPHVRFGGGITRIDACRTPDIQFPYECESVFYDNPMAFMMDPVRFLESLCDWGGHIHVRLFFRTTSHGSGMLDYHMEHRCAINIPMLVGRPR